MGQSADRSKARRWLRSLAAGFVALTLGFGAAHAEIVSAHEGGQGADKAHAFASATAQGNGSAHAFSSAIASRRSEVAGGGQLNVSNPKLERGKVTIAVDVDEEGIGTADWSRTVTRTATSKRFVSSTTRSYSYAADDAGNQAIAEAIARARAPNNAAAVRNGAGKVVAKTSVDVTGNAAGSAEAGGSIGVVGGKVKVDTWGETSAEVF